MAHPDKQNIAVFIDFDNIEIGVKSTLGENFDIGAILDAIKERGEVVTKIAYADWTRAGEYSRHLTQHAIRLVQRNLTPGGDKNGADINLALDALEMAFTHPHINAYVIVGGDSDFLSLVEKLKQYDKKVYVVGGRAFTSVILQRNCHEFIAYENITGGRRSSAKTGRPLPPPASSPLAQAFPIVRRALKILADREVSPQTGLLKSTLLQLDSTFSERTYGASSFLDFVEKLAQSSVVVLKHAGRSTMVELNPAFPDATEGEAAPRLADVPRNETPQSVDGEVVAQEAAPAPAFVPQHQVPPQYSTPGPVTPLVEASPELNAEGVREVARLLGAATSARWPMYVRNVKQILRAAEGGFDERKYGFAGIIELLRACQKDGLIRMERDRRGGLRVFPGPNLVRQTPPPSAVQSQPALQGQGDDEMGESAGPEPGNEALPAPPPVVVDIDAEVEQELNEPQPIDTTAELLGTVRPKRSRLRTALTSQTVASPSRTPRVVDGNRAPKGSSGGRKTASKKPAAPAAAKRSPRPRKPKGE